MRIPLLFSPAVLLLLACAPPQLTPDQQMALRQAQTRSFEVPYGTVFAATMTYLQDNAYQIRQAVKDAGLISAHKASQTQRTYTYTVTCASTPSW